MLHLLKSVDEGERSTFQPLRFRRGLLVSTDSSNGARDAAISASIRTEPTNSARLIDGPIASEVS